MFQYAAVFTLPSFPIQLITCKSEVKKLSLKIELVP